MTQVSRTAKIKTLVALVAVMLVAQPFLALPLAARAEEGSDGSGGDSQGGTVIDTGDSNGSIDIDNQVNLNSLNTGDVQPSDSDGGQGGESGGDAAEPAGDSQDQSQPASDGTDQTDGQEPAEPTDDQTGETAQADDQTDQNQTADDSQPDLAVDNDNQAELDNQATGAGSSGSNTIGQNQGDALINTGEVGLDSMVTNQVNGNDTNIDCPEPCLADTASSTTEIEVSNNNQAGVDNGVSLDGSSGSSTIEQANNALIQTGNIGIISAIINFVNYNFFGLGREFFINIFNSVFGNLDLSGYYDDDPSAGLEGCRERQCLITVDNDNTAGINNDVLIDASSGANTIASSSGTAVIKTGDINVLNDVVNVANLNLTGQDWFFAIVNVFGELNGNVVLPGIDGGDVETEAAELFDQLENKQQPAAQVIVANSNFADVVNNIVVNAETGRNRIDRADRAYIDTGQAVSEVHAVNLINYNWFGDRWRFVRVNIFGSWDGIIQGLPDGYDYFEDESGITVYNDLLDASVFNQGYQRLAVSNNNSATVNNNITINASSGDNEILDSQGEAVISTGDVYVRNNLLNFINSNFTGDGWEFSLINVFGAWLGNLSFGQPELWITESISPAGPVSRGDYITFTFLFGNRGDATAHNINIVDLLNRDLVRVFDPGSGSGGSGQMLWTIDKLPPNSQGSLSYTVQVNDDIAFGLHNYNNRVTIAANEDDRDLSNNNASGTIVIEAGEDLTNLYNAAAAQGNLAFVPLPSFAIVKSNDAANAVRPGDIVNYEIKVKNNGSAAATDVLVTDVMSNLETGEVINNDIWDLDLLYDGEEVVISYSIEIKPNIKSGVYINEAMVEGYGDLRNRYLTAVASSKIKVENPDYQPDFQTSQPGPQVLGVAGEPVLELALISRASLANPGDEITYEAALTNNGNITAYNSRIEVNLPVGLTFSDDGGIMKQWNLGDIDPGVFQNIEFKARVADSAQPGIYTVKARASADNNGEDSSSLDLEVREGQVLAATGFAASELILLLFLLTTVLGATVMLKRRLAAVSA